MVIIHIPNNTKKKKKLIKERSIQMTPNENHK